jgi:hypothetical protein
LYFRVLRISQSGFPPKRKPIPYRLCNPCLSPGNLSDIYSLAYGFTSCTGKLHSLLRTICSCTLTNRSTPWREFRVLLQLTFHRVPKADARSSDLNSYVSPEY